MRFIYVWAILVVSNFNALSQDSTAINEEDYALMDSLIKEFEGTLHPSVMDELVDSGLFDDRGMKTGSWREYFFKGCLSCEEQILNYDSLQYYDTHTHDITFYKYYGSYDGNGRKGLWEGYLSFRKAPPFEWSLDSRVNYLNGEKEGVEELIIDSVVYCRINYKNGKRDGLTTCYHKNGVVLTQSDYQDGALHGSFQMYNETGKIETEIFYESGEEVAIVLYKEDGYSLKAGKPHGKFKAYSYDEKLTAEGEFTMGQQTGLFKTYYDDGTLQSETNFEKGAFHGRYRYYHSNGKLWTEVLYKNGKAWTVISNYTSNGTKAPKGNLKNGKGTLLRYDASGKPISIEHYEDGNLLREETPKDR